jgi:tetraacyldisaccharide 4'-kinase
MTVQRLLLFPFTLLFSLATRVRNHLYNIGYSRAFNYDIMVINVGNLRVGGTGKTPMVEYLIRLLHTKYSLATLSRGYKRKTKGFLIADKNSSWTDLGDEPWQIFLKYGKVVTVTVGEERSLAIPNILMEHPETQAILMDDAYQHRAVKPDFNILLTEYANPFYTDYLMPAGRLREARSGARRADAVVVTKTPDNLSNNGKNAVIKNIRRYSGKDTAVFFTDLFYGKIRNLDNSPVTTDLKFVLFSGLANSEDFERYMRATFNIVAAIAYQDHHHYNIKEFATLVDIARQEDASLLTTEKDIVKLRSNEFIRVLKDVKLCYMPIEHRFIDNGSIFDEMVLQSVDKKYQVEER